MALSAGTRLGPYEILVPLGAGGMGEVYKAKDTRLDRTVAIKVLPEHLAKSPERKQRFEREAKAISQLNHPHICTLYDVGSQDGTDYLVMEYIEGETLAERLKRGALGLDQALEYGVQIADGLDKAHGAGIVHRDLKPLNIILTKSGVKLLDFGLARLTADEPVADSSDAPTQQKDLTKEQAIIGTLQYMAPEQLEGKRADARTDIFALGEVLYEMVTGKRAFEGESQASLISAIMTAQPRPLKELQPAISPAVDHVIHRMLTKGPDERWQRVSDVKHELSWVARERPETTVAAPPAKGSSRGFALAGLVLATAFGAALAWTLRPAPDVAPRRASLAVNLPPDVRVRMRFGEVSSPMALSRDGKMLVYVGVGADGQTELYRRPLSEFDTEVIPGTVGAAAPFLSPDGEWVAFFANGALQKVSLSGGTPLKICDAPLSRYEGSWLDDGNIVFSAIDSGGIHRVSSDGGSPEALGTPDAARGEYSHVFPRALPGSHALLFTIATFSGTAVAAMSVDSGDWDVLVENAAAASFVPSGHLLYSHSRGLWAMPFDPSSLEPKGPPVLIRDDVEVGGWVTIRPVFYAVSDEGLVAFVPSQEMADETLVWVDRQGRATPLSDERGRFVVPRLSPDGRRLSVGSVAGTNDIWVYDTELGTRVRLTTEADNWDSTWSPDGRRLVFNSTRGGQGLYVTPSDGSGHAEPLLIREHYQNLGDWSPDGGTLVYVELHPLNGADIWMLELDKDALPKQLLGSSFHEAAPAISPDGHFLAYVSDESGRNEVYVVTFPKLENKVSVSSEGGVGPRWARGGDELFYRNGEQMLAVPVTTEPEFRPGRRRILFEEPFKPMPPWGGYDVHPDGQRFVMIRSEDTAARTAIHVASGLLPSEK